MLRRYATPLAMLLLLAAPACFAQPAVSITNPVSSSTVSGFSYPLSATLTNISNAASIEWDIDQQTIEVLYTCASGTACPTYNWNSAEFANGVHQITATVRDALNNTVATSSAVSFTVNNSLPCNDGNGSYDEQITVTPSTSVSSSWSGTQTLTVSATGTQCSSYGWAWYAAVDGDVVASLTSSTASGGTLTLQTQNFYNGTRQVSIAAYQSFNATTQLMGSWLASVTFSNTGGGRRRKLP